ncbi:MAG: pyruvate, water dikinase regulatory protein [Gammaproteobacteria bacterium]
MLTRTVFYISDQTGITAETLGHSLLTQFEDVKFRAVTLPFIDTVDKAEEAYRRVNLTSDVEGSRPIVFSTFVQDDLRDIVSQSNGLFLDFFDAFIGPLEKELGSKSTHTTGKAHGVADSANYSRRMEAVNFAVTNDDGANVNGFSQAQVILVGVSRCGKTPTCLYLALQHGVFAANYPLNEDDFEAGRLPRVLEENKDKLYGLTIEPARLQQIREERRPDSRYSSSRQVGFELRAADALYRKYGVPNLNTTHTSIEEIAAKVMSHMHLKRYE